MSRWFRSEPMEYISVIVNEDAAHNCLEDLGRMGVIQFTDLNPDLTPFQRRYVSYIKRCDDLERRLRYFSSECERFELSVKKLTSLEEFLRTEGSVSLEELESELEEYESQLRELNSYSEKLTTEYNSKVELHEVLQKARQFFVTDPPVMEGGAGSSYGDGGERLRRARRNRTERTSSLLYDDDDEEEEEFDDDAPMLVRDHDAMRFSSLTGVVSLADRGRFERMIFRATRGNCYVRFAPVRQLLTDLETGVPTEKCVFIVFYKSLSIEVKLTNICDAFGAHRYALPDMDDGDTVESMLRDNATELTDSRTVLLKNQDTRYRMCRMLAHHLERWTRLVLREKAVYHSLNMFSSPTAGLLRGEGWVLQNRWREVADRVARAHADDDDVGTDDPHFASDRGGLPSLVDKCPPPPNAAVVPTHFVTNKFTYAYQEFVNTYGIPRYREANPALLTAATFPFLFGVMYGDVGHGTFLLLLGLWLLWKEREHDRASLGELTGGLHTARYMLAMMGFFAVYAGLIYNDCFSLGLNLFGSRYSFQGEDTLQVQGGTVATTHYAYGDPRNVYPFGLDPVWHVSTNELLFFNSFKMKLSVILGIVQMTMGTVLKGANAVFFREKTDLYYEVLPMLLFSVSLFVYMVFLIFLKWSIDWGTRMFSSTCLPQNDARYGDTSLYPHVDWKPCTNDAGYGCTPGGYVCDPTDTLVDRCPLDYGGSGDGCQPPNLITTLINIALKPGVVDEPLYPYQGTVQTLLLLLAVGSVPVLLFVKPCLLSKRAAQQQRDRAMYQTVERGYRDDPDEDEDEEDEQSHPADDDHDDEHSFGELMIHQGIETIEFVLGMVSNTASYLRLWALSLAHSELATVFWEKAMLSTLSQGWVASYFGFGIFAGATTGVLLLMDVLECFLHALRLHWVEFQSKFFKADGVRFVPYSFQQVMEDQRTT